MSSESQQPPTPSPFAPVRRVVTGHRVSPDAAQATVLRDAVLPAQFWYPGSVNAVYDLYRTDESPAVVDEEVRVKESGEGGEGGDSGSGWVDVIAKNTGPGELTSPGGSTFRSFDLAPGSVVPMHRTTTIDYGIILAGEVTMVLDDGSTTVLKAHDVVVQRGTMHAWRNDSPSEWARMMFVMLPAQKITVNGTTLEAGTQAQTA